MIDKIQHIIVQEKAPRTENKIPIFILPDATGSSEALTELGKSLNRPVYYLRDARLSLTYNSDRELSVERLAMTYTATITQFFDALQNSYTDDTNNKDTVCDDVEDKIVDAIYKNPIILIGYSGGGILLKHIEKLLTNKFPPSHVISVYIDSVSPTTMQAIPVKEMTEHFIDIMTKLAHKYINEQTPLKEQQIRSDLTKCQNINEQITYLLTAVNYSPSSLLDIDPFSLVKQSPSKIRNIPIESFQTACNVMLYNHLAYLNDKSKLKIFPHSTFIVTDDTIKKCQSYLNTTSDCTLLGWISAETLEQSSIEIIKESDHYSVLSDCQHVEQLAKKINELFNNDQSIRVNAAFKQAIYSLSALSKVVDKNIYEYYLQHYTATMLKAFHEVIPTTLAKTNTIELIENKDKETKNDSVPDCTFVNVNTFSIFKNRPISIIKQTSSSAESLKPATLGQWHSK